jgi:hypothetical protein
MRSEGHFLPHSAPSYLFAPVLLSHALVFHPSSPTILEFLEFHFILQTRDRVVSRSRQQVGVHQAGGKEPVGPSCASALARRGHALHESPPLRTRAATRAAHAHRTPEYICGLTLLQSRSAAYPRRGSDASCVAGGRVEEGRGESGSGREAEKQGREEHPASHRPAIRVPAR